MAWTVQRQAHFCAVNAHSPNKRICAKYADQNALADKCYGIGYIVQLAFSSFVFFLHRPTMLWPYASVLGVCVCALHATNYTDVHIDKIFDSSRYVENGIHIRFAFQFGSLRWLCGFFYSFANYSRFVRMWKICFYGASLSKRVSTFAVPTTLFVMLRSNEIRSIVVNRSWLSYSSKSMQRNPLHSLCQSCMTLTVNKNCSPSARSAL